MIAVRRLIILLYFCWLSALSQAVSVKPLESTTARQALIKQLEFLMIAEEDSLQLAELKLHYAELTASQPLSLSELVSEVSQFWQLDTELFKSLSLIEQAKLLTPKHPSYQTSRQRITYLNQQQQNLTSHHSNWVELSLDRYIKPGESHPIIQQVRHRLVLLGDLSHTLRMDTGYDRRLVDAMMKFQLRHGLKVDGIIGGNTLYWLNKTPGERAQLLVQNFIRQERWAKQIGRDYLVVNIPQFQLKLIHGGEEVIKSKVTVGRPYRTTKLIYSEIESLVVNPGWNVPYTILKKDILPKLQKDIDYLADKKFEVFDNYESQEKVNEYDMKQLVAGIFPYRVYQPPGPLNPLGNYKLHFANPYSIYLHDTPQKKQFDLSSRALSSGCVRIEKASQIARWLAVNRGINQNLWQQFENDDETTRWLKLASPMPIYIVYWTAWTEPEKLPQYRNDIYDWEANSKKLAENWVKPEKIKNVSIKTTQISINASK